MKKFIDKLIARLEEEQKKQQYLFNNVLNNEHQRMIHEYAEQCYLYMTDIVNELAEEMGVAKNAITNGWIPVSERLPEEQEDVLVWFEYFRYGEYNGLYQRMGISYTFRGDWSGFVNGQSGWNKLKIIAWQPLPQPYVPKGE